MLTNLIVTVQDTESGSFAYEGNLTRETYEEMVMDKFNRTNKQVDDFVHGYREYRPNNFAYDLPREEEYYEGPDNDAEVEVQALLLDGNRNDFNEDFLFDHIDDGRMFVMLVNLNPETIDCNAESEIRYWIDDSMRVWEDEQLDKQTKLLASPPRDFKIVLSDGHKYTLSNCKLFENYEDDRFPLYFAMIVEKIIP